MTPSPDTHYRDGDAVATTLAHCVARLEQATQKLDGKTKRFNALLSEFEAVDLPAHLRSA